MTPVTRNYFTTMSSGGAHAAPPVRSVCLLALDGPPRPEPAGPLFAPSTPDRPSPISSSGRAFRGGASRSGFSIQLGA